MLGGDGAFVPLTATDVDSGAGTDYAMPVALRFPASGGGVTASGDASGLDVDTELPAAAALSDTIANPTTPMVGAGQMLWDGTQWVRVKGANAAVATSGTGLPGVAAMGFDGVNYQRLIVPGGDGLSSSNTPVGASAMLFNGSSWDRCRGNFDTTTGDTGTKTATFNGATQTNYNATGAIITVKLGTVSGTSPTLACQLQWSYDGGTNFLNVGPAMANLTASNQTGVFLVYPSNTSQAAGTTPVNMTTGATQTVALNMALPRLWRIVYTIGGTTPSFALTATYVNYQVY